jgi:hypothetical protein
MHGRDMTCIQSLVGKPTHKWEDNIRVDFGEQGGKLYSGFIWLKIGTSGRLL